ncbi:MAG: bifunctional metallophosphatase/5'-nucleotidase, partial [Bacteroidaceae bacterium]|nr:bifunctional metallophosphatase/5'-nucleotidase [Bacteroidaceae bacterium]
MGDKSVKKVTLRWVHTSDLHGNMFMYDDLKCVRTHGGASAVYGYVESLRERYPDSVICTDGGDCLQGQPVSYYYNYIDREQNIVNEMMNAIGYDAAT